MVTHRATRKNASSAKGTESASIHHSDPDSRGSKDSKTGLISNICFSKGVKLTFLQTKNLSGSLLYVNMFTSICVFVKLMYGKYRYSLITTNNYFHFSFIVSKFF